MKTRFIDAIVKIENDTINNVQVFKDFDKFKIDDKEVLQLGTAKKRFVRTSGQVLLDMYDEISSGQIPNAVTCVDDAIKSGSLSREEFADTYISTIVKKARRGDIEYKNSELIASRISQILGVKTSYIAPYGDKNSDQYICVDFLKDKEEIVDFCEFTGATFIDGVTLPAEVWLQYLERGMEKNLPKQSHVREKLRDDIITDFIRWYLVNVAILKNDDIGKYNVAFIHKEGQKNFSLAPAYDLEYTMGKTKGRIEFFPFEAERRLEESIEYFIKNYPKHLEKAMQDINIQHSAIDMHRVNRVIEEFSGQEKGDYSVLHNRKLENSKTMSSYSLEADAMKIFFQDNLRNLVKVYERKKSERSFAETFVSIHDEKEL